MRPGVQNPYFQILPKKVKFSSFPPRSLCAHDRLSLLDEDSSARIVYRYNRAYIGSYTQKPKFPLVLQLRCSWGVPNDTVGD